MVEDAGNAVADGGRKPHQDKAVHPEVPSSELDKDLEVYAADLSDPEKLKDLLKQQAVERKRLSMQLQWITSQQELLHTLVHQPIQDNGSREPRTSEWAPWEQEVEYRAKRNVERDPNLAETVVREHHGRGRKSPVRRADAGGRARTDVAEPDAREEDDWRREAQAKYPVPVFGRSHRYRSPASQCSNLGWSEQRVREEGLGDPEEEFLKVERGAIKVPAGIGQGDVLPPKFDGRNPKDWLGFRTQFELYLAGRKATSVSAQKRLLLSCLDGPLRSEFAEKWETTMGEWIDLENYWLQLNKRFTWGKKKEHPTNPEAWMADHPWDGYEWTLSPFLDGVLARAKNLLPSSWSDKMVASAAARMVYERGLPSELLRELNTKKRAHPDLRRISEDLNELEFQIFVVFREYADSHTEVPWLQKADPNEECSQSYEEDSEGSENRSDDEDESKEKPLERWKSSEEEWRRKQSDSSPYPSDRVEPRGSGFNEMGRNGRSDQFNTSSHVASFPTQQQTAHGTGGRATSQQDPRQSTTNPAKIRDLRGRPRCEHCGKLGHVKGNCWFLHEELRLKDYRSSPEGEVQVLQREEWKQRKKIDEIYQWMLELKKNEKPEKRSQNSNAAAHHSTTNGAECSQNCYSGPKNKKEGRKVKFLPGNAHALTMSPNLQRH